MVVPEVAPTLARGVGEVGAREYDKVKLGEGAAAAAAGLDAAATGPTSTGDGKQCLIEVAGGECGNGRESGDS